MAWSILLYNVNFLECTIHEMLLLHDIFTNIHLFFLLATLYDIKFPQSFYHLLLVTCIAHWYHSHTTTYPRRGVYSRPKNCFPRCLTWIIYFYYFHKMIDVTRIIIFKKKLSELQNQIYFSQSLPLIFFNLLGWSVHTTESRFCFRFCFFCFFYRKKKMRWFVSQIEDKSH